MKRFLIILLIVCILVVAPDIVLAKVSFGGWDKWDEELPPKNSKSWHWVWPSKKAEEWNIKDFGKSGNDIIVLCSTLYYGRKFGMKAVSVIFYSSGNVSVNDWNISNSTSTFALAAFPPKKGKVVIRAYKMEENQVFKCFEEWEIAYNIFEIVVPEIVVPQGKFRQTFKEWLGSLSTISSFKVELENEYVEVVLNLILPKVLVSDKSFVISNGKLFIKK